MQENGWKLDSADADVLYADYSAHPYIKLARNLYAWFRGRGYFAVQLYHHYRGSLYRVCEFLPTRHVSRYRILSRVTDNPDTFRVHQMEQHMRGWRANLPPTLKAKLPIPSEPSLNGGFANTCFACYGIGGYVEATDHEPPPRMPEKVELTMGSTVTPGLHWFAPARLAWDRAMMIQLALPETGRFIVHPSMWHGRDGERVGWWGVVTVVASDGSSESMKIFSDYTAEDIQEEHGRLMAWSMNHTPIPGPAL